MNYKKFLGAASAALMIVILFTLMLAPGAWAQSKYKTLYKFKGGKDGVYPIGRGDLRRRREMFTARLRVAALMARYRVPTNPSTSDVSWTKTGAPPASQVARTDPSPYAGGVTLRPGWKSLRYNVVRRQRLRGPGTVFELSPNPNGSWSEKRTLLRFSEQHGWGPATAH